MNRTLKGAQRQGRKKERLAVLTLAGYNVLMLEKEQHHHLPEMDRLSLLAATVLLAYAVASFIDLPARELSVQLPGVYLAVRLDGQAIVALLIAGLTASGADWLIRSHPLIGKQSSSEHWLLPALTAWVIGLPLSQLERGAVWWVGFALGGVLLMLALVAEYISVDTQDVRYPAAAAWLTAVAFTLYLVLAAAVRYGASRLFIVLPALGMAGLLVSLRALRLRLQGRWAFLEAGVVTLATVQFAAALHYWPLSPVTYGLLLLGPAYALTVLVGNMADGESLRQAVVEPSVILAVVWIVAILVS